ncbi:MAG: TIGR00303 family protein, partial [Gloeomargaritaceae cyanobacterium C42_A2020_066]|nr:TIGR00303 family protein [Gloeomargaritaceae cyanobacterium C42_A2020_066]
MLQVYRGEAHALAWWARHAGRPPLLACVVGFTETALIPGISAAGNTPAARQTTALADAEFLLRGRQPRPAYPLPPLTQGASPVYLTRAVVQNLGMPTLVFNAGLPLALPVPAIDLGGRPAACVRTGRAMPRALVEHL